MKSRSRRLLHILSIEMLAWAVILVIAVVNAIAGVAHAGSLKLAAASGASSSSSASKLVLPRESHVPGGVFTTVIPGAADQRPVASFDGQPAMVVRESDHWRAVV